MSKRSIFFDAWQACLRAHYIHVIRTNDAVTEPTLRAVLLQTGLSEVDLHALYQEAAALGPAEPDAEILTDPEPLPEPEPLSEELFVEDVPVLDVLPEIEEPIEEIEDVEEVEVFEEDSTPPDEPPPAQQLSMF